MQKKIKNWEELINDGENYGEQDIAYSPMEKKIIENVKDKTVLKIQDCYAFIKTGEATPEHGRELATVITNFEPLKDISTLIITHNALCPEGVRIISESKILPKVTYLHLGSNNLGDEGAEIVARAELFSEVKTLNLEYNGITGRGGRALAESPVLIQLESLNLVDNCLGDEGALAIADSDSLANLTYLHLGGNRVKSEAAKSALKESKKLSKLQTLKVF